MAKPPIRVFQKMTNSFTRVKENIKKNTIKYFLVIFILIEIITHLTEKVNKVLYDKVLFNVFIQLQFFILFIFLLRFNFCTRNKVIIYSLLTYFLSNIILPFYITSEVYTNFCKHITMILLTLLLGFTLFAKNKSE